MPADSSRPVRLTHLNWEPWSEPLQGLDLELVRAIEQRDFQLLQGVIDRGGRPHRFDPWSWISPVALAVHLDFDAAVPLLLEHGDSPWHGDNEGLHAVGYALLGGKVDLVARMTAGTTLDEQVHRTPNALVLAIQGGHVPMVQYLLDQGWPLGTVDLDNLRDTMRTGFLFSTHDEREDGPFAAGESTRMQHGPAVRSLIEQRILRDSLNDQPESPVPAARARPRL